MRKINGGLRISSVAPSSCSSGRGVARRISSAPKTPCKANESTSHSPMNWKSVGSSGLSAFNQIATIGIESVKPIELPIGQMSSGVAPNGNVHGP